MKLFLTLVQILFLTSLLNCCPNKDEYCASCSKEDKCLLCYGSVLEGGICQEVKKTVKFCKIYAADGICHTCINGYYSFNGACLSNPIKNCVVYDPNTKKCALCILNRFPKNNKCSSGLTPCFVGK